MAEQIAGKFNEIVELKAERAERAEQDALELALAEDRSQAKDQHIDALDKQIANLRARTTAQEQEAAKALAEMEMECTHWRNKWCDLERAHIALEGRLGDCQQVLERRDTEITKMYRIHEEAQTKRDIVLERESNRKKEEIATYKKKLGDSESSLHVQTGLLEKANADLGKLRREEWKFNQESRRHLQKKAHLEDTILKVRQRNAVLQGKLNEHVHMSSRISDIAKMINLPLETAETNVGLSPNVIESSIGGKEDD